MDQKENKTVTKYISVWKIMIIVLIQVVIALIHILRFGQAFSGKTKQAYYGYFSDFILPFGVYFLLSINDANFHLLRKWYVKAGIVFFTCTAAEIGQYFGYPVLGVTFDPLDIVVYGAGVLTAVFVDLFVFDRLFDFWTFRESSE